MALGSRAFDVLQALIEHRERIVTKNELLDLAWPGVVVEENNLQVQISTLRKILGPLAIATIPGRGYRLTLEEAPTRGQASEPTSPTDIRGSEPTVGSPRASPVEQARGHGDDSVLVGRVQDLARILDLLGRGGAVTLVGPGGVGKTALARAAAQHCREQSKEIVAWADLAPVRDSEMLVPIFARALDIEMPPGESSIADIARFVKRRSILLVLDNAEHLVDAVAEAAATLVAASEKLRLLITSREPLHIQNERVYRLKGLEVPEHGVDAPRPCGGAVALFVRRVGHSGVNFAAEQAVDDIADICRRLDGLPLAIEMAAARFPSLGAKGSAGFGATLAPTYFPRARRSVAA